MRTSLREDIDKQPTGLTMPLTAIGFAHTDATSTTGGIQVVSTVLRHLSRLM